MLTTLGVIPLLIDILQNATYSEETRVIAMWGLSNILVNDDTHESFLEHGGTKQVAACLLATTNDVKFTSIELTYCRTS